jgi:hypothetical protein
MFAAHAKWKHNGGTPFSIVARFGAKAAPGAGTCHLGVKIEEYLLRVDGPWIATCRRRDEQGQKRWPDRDKTAFDKIPCYFPAKAPYRERQFPAGAAGKRVNWMRMYLIDKSFSPQTI